MYELEYPAPAINAEGAPQDKGPTLIVALHGYADAGQAIEASADHLKAALNNRLVATFDADELIDYRSRRPATTVSGDNPIEIENLDLDMRAVWDVSGKPFLLLSGPEPDLRWQGFSRAVTDLVKKFNVEDTIMVYAAPTPSPHTRPLVVSAHGNSKKLVDRMFRFDQSMMVPGSAQLFIEKELAKQGRNVAGYTAHVPHYLASSPYPQAIYSLLDSVSKVVGLDLPLKSIASDIEKVAEQLEEQVMDSEEIQGVVAQLEEQYDSYVERYRNENPQAILPGEPTVPSGEEISEEFEKFLDALGNEDSWKELLLNQDLNDQEESVIEETTDSTGPDVDSPDENGAGGGNTPGQ
ncbi:proteasome protein [Corynebacterium phocae]|uniref:Proteasome protein n=2 Tax=Corynebacterium phocae TaxID=161895 RepID=A0A1L7D6V0_9CORY|nr:proteasome protein [Corynebacterium phocae]